MLDRMDKLLAQRAEPGQPPPEPPKAAPVAAFPGYDEYLTNNPGASYEDYLDARTEAKLEARQTADRQRFEADGQTRVVANALHQIETLGAKTHADFEATVQSAFDAGIRWAPHVTEFVTRHTESAQEAVALTYALAKDHALVTRINRLPSGRAAYELGKIISSLSTATPAASTAQPVATPVTRAPDPILPVGTRAAASPVTPESLVAGKEFSLKQFRAALER